jgi:membrane protein DedA with SNARE-associated domain/membrane-associated phospholipid phosphatase
MIDTIARHILGLSGWAALAVVFLFPLLEASAFVGVVVPGEIAVLLGGVLAANHRVSLAAVFAAAIAGAVIGDSVGYWVGHRYGTRLLDSRPGRVVRPEHRRRGERYLAERGGRAVLLGRFTAALRALIPGLAGMARMPYRTFLVYNLAGAALWASAVVLAGYLAGASWQRAAHWASRVGLAILVLVGLALVLRVVARRAGPRLRAARARVAAAPAVAHARRRFPGPVRWLGRRLDPGTPDGLALTVTVLVAAGFAAAFASVAQDVAAVEESALLDPRVQQFAVEHRTAWLTPVMAAAAWLGSGYVLVPVLVGGTVPLLRRGDRRGAGRLWAAAVGVVALYAFAKLLVPRPPPPAVEAIGHVAGPAFPSGQVSQAVAAWGMLATVYAAGRTGRVRAAVCAAAALVVVLIGAAQVYLGLHWLTDVLGGYALAGCWLAVLVGLHLRWLGRRGTRVPARATAGPRPDAA